MFADRATAGRRLTDLLGKWRYSHPVVLGVPRGGMPVASEVADALNADLDVLVAHRLLAPGHQQPIVLGGIAEDGITVVHHSGIQHCDLTRQQVAALQTRARSELDRDATLYRHGMPRLSLAGRFVILVDDGIATGATASAACRSVRSHGPCRLVLATPVAAHHLIPSLCGEADDVVSLITPDRVGEVGSWYEEDHQVTYTEITRFLADHSGPAHSLHGRDAYDE
jgi:putative phosphoribosyl transferase